jgi:hypothetical protein
MSKGQFRDSVNSQESIDEERDMGISEHGNMKIIEGL